MALNSTTNATELTAEQVLNVLVKPLEQRSVFLAAVVAGGGMIVDTAGPLRIPKGAAPTTPAWYAQNTLIAESDPTFGELSLLPSTMQSVKVITRFSNELSRQSIIALDAALRARLVTDVASVLDTQLMSGGTTGDGVTKPKGLFSCAGQTTAATGALTLDKLIDAEGLALSANVNADGLTWVMSSREFIGLRKQKDTTNRYQLQPDPTKAGAFTLFGHRVLVTNRVPTTAGTPATGNLALVDFSQIVVARDVAPSVKILDQTYGDFDQQAIRVVARYDAAPINAAAIITLTGITI